MTYQRKEVIGDCTLYLGDCREVLPTLAAVDAVITDPPYGIKMANGSGGGGKDGFGNGIKRTPKAYDGAWDDDRPGREVFERMLTLAPKHIFWGGNYFADLLPASTKWLWWDKCQTMPSYSDGELAWTSLPGTSTKKFVYNGSGLMAKEKDRVHPTQKPVELMKWCLQQADTPPHTLDPFMGSGSTGVACARLRLRFTGVEREVGFFDAACRRIEEAYRQPDMFVAPPPPPPAVQGGLDL